MAEKIVQTAGRNQLGEFAPMFAHLKQDVSHYAGVTGISRSDYL